MHPAQQAEVDIDLPIFSNEELAGMPARFALAKGPILKNGIKGIHEAFADYMLINPGCTLRSMKAQFGYSVSWICTVINSDMFKAYFNQRRRGIEVTIAQDLPSRLQAAAALATERVIDIIETSGDQELVLDAFDKILHRAGFAPNSKGAQGPTVNNTQNNVFYLEKGQLDAARQLLVEAHKPKELEVKGEVVEGAAVPTS